MEAAQSLTRRGYLMATGGNVSIRIPGERAFAVTPSDFDYLKMTPQDVCVLDFDLRVLAGDRKPSIESGLHCEVYRVRSDAGAVVHTHQVNVSALATINAPIPALFDEQVRFLGRSVEILRYAPSGTGMLVKRVSRALANHHNAYILQNHGALCLGEDMERAVHNVEILEKCAVAYLLALCTERRPTRIPLAVREIAFAKLRAAERRAAESAAAGERAAGHERASTELEES